MAGPIVSTPFQRGRPVGWAELEAIRNEIARLKPNSGIGYRLNQSPSGWSLSIPSATTGGSKASYCPFAVSTANPDPEHWKFTISWGLIGGKLPEGMSPNDDPPFLKDWENGWVVAACKFVENDVVIDTVSFEVHADIPANTTDTAYYAIAYIDTDSSGPKPVQRIQNVCVTPNPSVCDLAMESA
jgi:hypothetical protein